MMVSLPPEIWNIILNKLLRRDQVRVSQASSHLCALARRCIFREVQLWSDKNISQVILALFANDYSVAIHVERLYIHTGKNAVNKPAWLNPDALAGMKRLYHISFTGMPFYTKEDQDKFNQVMLVSLPALKRLEYMGERWSPSTARGLDPLSYSPSLEVKGLEEITWNAPDTFTHPSYILPIFTASFSTLVQIHIPAPARDSLHNTLTQFFAFRFPCLSTSVTPPDL
ncbi:hypothetical protein BDZ94DRAFT_1326971 [Collybia nuda]|uniref:F-box domain-containing protein n=1 Tax=Collybia nuda TaxID=64659 RepID=A0A9P5XT90_9AGAR|nr:hypothetical protein BDZ94DRAFT_1326971 [Collybia nuda]